MFQSIKEGSFERDRKKKERNRKEIGPYPSEIRMVGTYTTLGQLSWMMIDEWDQNSENNIINNNKLTNKKWICGCALALKNKVRNHNNKLTITEYKMDMRLRLHAQK